MQDELTYKLNKLNDYRWTCNLAIHFDENGNNYLYKHYCKDDVDVFSNDIFTNMEEHGFEYYTPNALSDTEIKTIIEYSNDSFKDVKKLQEQEAQNESQRK